MPERLAPIPRSGQSVWEMVSAGNILPEHVNSNGVLIDTQLSEINRNRPPVRLLRLPSLWPANRTLPIRRVLDPIPRERRNRVQNRYEHGSREHGEQGEQGSREHGERFREHGEQRCGFREQPELSAFPVCVVCMQRHRNVVCIPCFHLCVCQLCSTKLASCPICRKSTNFQRIFIS